MDQAVTAVLAEYEVRAAAEQPHLDAALAGRETINVDEMLLPVGAQTGALLNLLIRAGNCRSILEIGTSFGYSTIWLAEAVRATGGRVATLELHPGKSKFAGERLAQAGLTAQVDLHVGDALKLLAQLPGPFDFVLLDLWKDLYVPCFDLFYPKLAPQATIVADNMVYPQVAQQAAQRYRRHVRCAAGISSVLLSVGSGIEISRFRCDP